MNQKALAILLKSKIILTIAMWAIPLLIFPKSIFEWIGIPFPEPAIFLRLLGVSYIALCIGYGWGMVLLNRGENPFGILLMGMVSNGFACILIIFFGITGTYKDWSLLGKIYIYLSAGITGSITLLLILLSRKQKQNHKTAK
jgi:hypothetical protein